MTNDLAIVRLEWLDLLVVALLVLIVSEFICARVAPLQKYNIPSAVIGGIVCSIAIAGLGAADVVRVEIGTELRGLLLLVFFATIGLSMNLQALRGTAKAMLILLTLASALLIFQNMVGSSIAAAFGFHPASGLLAGSISFVGGHGTGIAWSGVFAERYGIEGAEQAALTLATLGLLAGGLFGGPLAEFLIRRNRLEDDERPQQEMPVPIGQKAVWDGMRPSMLHTGILIALCVYLAPLASDALLDIGITLPAFMIALLAGAVLINLAEVSRIALNPADNRLICDISLQFFLIISVMNISLPFVAEVAIPILAVGALQILLVLAFAYVTVFPVMGRNYESAVMCAGFVGFSLGSSLIGMANMRAVTHHYGAAPAAFIVVPVVGSFLIDLVNSLIIELYILSPVLNQMP